VESLANGEIHDHVRHLPLSVTFISARLAARAPLAICPPSWMPKQASMVPPLLPALHGILDTAPGGRRLFAGNKPKARAE
jgi:hypothetical protein